MVFGSRLVKPWEGQNIQSVIGEDQGQVNLCELAGEFIGEYQEQVNQGELAGEFTGENQKQAN